LWKWNAYTKEDIERIREIMLSVVERDQSKLETLLEMPRDYAKHMWRLIDDTYFEVTAPSADNLFNNSVLICADDGYSIDVRFDNIEGHPSDLILSLDAFTDISPSRFVLTGLKT
jgi:hypothetical protein